MDAFPLKVGAAKVDITPRDQPTAPATGKYDHDWTYIRAIVPDNNATCANLISIKRERQFSISRYCRIG
jgi:hypothetical protein